MCKMLLSINPEHIENIFNGKKKFEFRKIKCRDDVDTIIFYSTAPVKKVVGEAKIKEILVDVPSKIWEKTKVYSGIKYSFFHKYYLGKEQAVAYHLCDIKQYDEPTNLSDWGIDFAPQSFVYI